MISKLKEIFWPGKGVGLPLYLEEGEEIFGYVTKVIREGEKVEGYEVTVEGGVSLNFPADSIVVSKKIVIYRPKWFNEALEFVRTLETQKTISSEFKKVLDGSLKPKDAIAKKLVMEGKSIYKSISEKLMDFVEEKSKLKEELEDLLHRKILRMSSGAEYAKNLIRIKKKMQLLDVSIKRAEEILRLLDYKIFKEEENVRAEPSEISSISKPISAEEKAKIKKLRVLKIERDLMLREERLRKAEEELKKNVSFGGISYEIRWIEERISEIDEEVKSIEDVISSAKKLDDITREYLLSRKELLLAKKKSLLARKEELERNASNVYTEEEQKEESKLRI